MVSEHYVAESGFAVRLEARLKNARLVNARESLGLTAKTVAEKIGIAPPSYSRYENMRTLPSPRVQEKICRFYRKKGVFLLEEDVFPEELRHVRPQKRYVAERTVPKEQLLSLSYMNQRQLPACESKVEESMNTIDLKTLIHEAMSSLTSREAEVLRLRYLEDDEPPSFEQLAERIGVSPERARQIHNIALEKLQRPSRSKKLRDFLE